MIRTPVVDGPTIGALARGWMEDSLVYGPGDRMGEPYRVDPYFTEFLDDLYRVDRDGRRIVRRALLSVGKGGAKTEFQAGIDLFELDGPCVVDPGTGRAVRRRSPDIPCSAASFDQASLVFGAAQAMCEPISQRLNVYDKVIERLDGSGRMYRVYAAAGTNDGLRPTSVSVDELHEWTGNKERVYLVLTNGLAKRADSFELSVTTAGDPNQSHLLRNLYEYGQRVATGEVDDPSFLMHWYEPSDPTVDLNDHDALIAAIRDANPGSWIDPERIAKRWTVDRIKEHEFRRYHLNQWVTTSESWFKLGEWESRYASVPVNDGDRVVLSFDGSYNGDSTVLYATTIDTDLPHVFQVGVWERPDGVDDWKVDRVAVDAAVDAAFLRWDVVELVCDPARWSLYMNEWVERYGEDRVLEYPQRRSSMVPATSKAYDAVTQGLVTHDGSHVLARHIGNATVKSIPDGRYVLTKDHPERKIDAAIAFVMGFDRATWRRDNDDGFVGVTLM